MNKELKEKLNELIKIGNYMSNVCFNESQTDHKYKEGFKLWYKTWDLKLKEFRKILNEK